MSRNALVKSTFENNEALAKERVVNMGSTLSKHYSRSLAYADIFKAQNFDKMAKNSDGFHIDFTADTFLNNEKLIQTSREGKFNNNKTSKVWFKNTTRSDFMKKEPDNKNFSVELANQISVFSKKISVKDNNESITPMETNYYFNKYNNNVFEKQSKVRFAANTSEFQKKESGISANISKDELGKILQNLSQNDVKVMNENIIKMSKTSFGNFHNAKILNSQANKSTQKLRLQKINKTSHTIMPTTTNITSKIKNDLHWEEQETTMNNFNILEKQNARKIPKKYCQSVNDNLKAYHKFEATSTTQSKNLDYLMSQYKIGNIFNVSCRLKARMENNNDYYLRMSEMDTDRGCEIEYHRECLEGDVDQTFEKNLLSDE